LVAVCGDGIVSAVNDEECDDANDDPTDSCTNACTWNVVGDGVRYLTKTDEGNPNALHNCDSGGLYDPHETSDLQDADELDDGFTDGEDFCAVTDNDDETKITSNLRCPSIDGGVTANPSRDWATWIDAADTCVFALESYSVATGDETGSNSADDNTFDEFTGTWDQAAAKCEGLGWGAHLVVINNTSITRAIVGDLVEEVNDGVVAGDDAWIGLIDRAKPPSTIQDGPGSWFWIDNSAGPSVANTDAWRQSTVVDMDEPNQDNAVDAVQEDCGALVYDSDDDEGGPDTQQNWVYADETCSTATTIAVCAFTCTAEGNCQQ
jgi:cysteine-rich repeat protein